MEKNTVVSKSRRSKFTNGCQCFRINDFAFLLPFKNESQIFSLNEVTGKAFVTTVKCYLAAWI